MQELISQFEDLYLKNPINILRIRNLFVSLQTIKGGKDMTTLQLNQELLRQVGAISNDETLLQKAINYIKSITPAKQEKSKNKKKALLDNIISMSKPCPLTDAEINAEIEAGRKEFYEKKVLANEDNN